MSRKKLLQNLPDRTVLKRRALAKERVQQYNLFSDLFMSVALDDKKACEYVLRIIMGKPDLVVKRVETQETLSKVESRGVRLDVLAEDSEGQIFNIEVQRADTVDHARRIRLYSSMIDSELLQKGAAFGKLPTLVMIYISETNIWKLNGAMSRVTKVWEDNGTPFDDGLEIIGVNAAVDDGSQVAALMSYFKTANPADESQGELSQRVKYLKTNQGGIQMFIDKMDINYLEGREEGREENALKSAQKMLAKKICTDEEIAEITELPLETILRLKAQLSQTQAGTVLPVKKI